jgi:hypothetical protein
MEKQCILDAGTGKVIPFKDLDLSYRAQLKAGNSNISKMSLPAELPAIISAAPKQFRWNKGGAEFQQKRDSSTTIRIYWVQDKAHGMLHLLNSTMFWQFYNGNLKCSYVIHQE